MLQPQLVSITNITTAVNPSLNSRRAPRTTVMKQPRNRRGHSLQRNDEDSFHHMAISTHISLLPVLSAKVFYLTLPQVTFLHTCTHCVWIHTTPQWYPQTIPAGQVTIPLFVWHYHCHNSPRDIQHILLNYFLIWLIFSLWRLLVGIRSYRVYKGLLSHIW